MKHIKVTDYTDLPFLLTLPDGESPQKWLKSNTELVKDKLMTDGALLIQKSGIISGRQFGKLIETAFQSDLLTYNNRSTPRTEIGNNVYTSTEYPQEEVIPLHNENAYSHEWPNILAFLCMTAAETGGETPIADSRAIYRDIDPDIRAEFESKGVLYQRNFGDMGLSWEEVFQTSNKSEVEYYCRTHQIEFEWFDRNLRILQKLPAVRTHPKIGVKTWFNQAHLFHLSSHAEHQQQTLLKLFGKAHLPRHAYFGDGSDIDDAILSHIRTVYDKHTVKFTWQKGDLLLLDNLLFCHGRSSYTGSRRVLVSMV